MEITCIQDIVTKASKKNVFREGLQESKSPEKYRTYNLLHKDKAHSGIRGTNLGWLTTLYLKKDNGSKEYKIDV
jgi:hypothetical protein